MPSADEVRSRVRDLERDLSLATTTAEEIRLLNEIGDRLLELGHEEAQPWFERAIALARASRDYDAMAHAARVMAEACCDAPDMALADRYLGVLQEAADVSGRLRLQGSCRYVRGELAICRGEYEQARREYEECRRLWQADGFTRGEAFILVQLGNVCGQQGDSAGALECYQEVLARAGELGDRQLLITAWNNVGWALVQLGRWEDAVESFYRALAMGDSGAASGPIYNALGELFVRRDKLDKAVDMLRRVAGDSGATEHVPAPVAFDTYLNLGIAYQRQDNLAGAAASYARALALAEQSTNRHDRARVLTQMAELAIAQGDAVRAGGLADEAVDLARQVGARRDESAALRVRGQVEAARGATAAASASLEAAVALVQDAEDGYEMAMARYQHGRVLIEADHRDAAVGQLKAASRVFRKLSIVAEAEEINRLLFRLELRTDNDVALLQGISRLVPLGLDPKVMVEQTLRLICEALEFESAVVFYRGQPVFIHGAPDLTHALSTADAGQESARTPKSLSWPVSYGANADGRIYLERGRPSRMEHSPLVLDTVANLLALPIQRTAETALRIVQDRDELAGLRFNGIVGGSSAMVNLLARVCHLAGTDLTVLIHGETGTGKELLARALHDSGPRLAMPFVPVNCAAVPDNLLEAEFFGVERGAATGVASRPGRFEAAGAGTVFLDEVGDMSPALQASLLRVLEDKTVVRVGGRGPIRIEARVVAATNHDLKKEVAQGTFRSDLYYRLSGVELAVPPLRERPEDIEDLVRHIVARVNQEYHRQVRGVSPEALQRLRAYRWPGNIRELQHVLERAVILAASDTLMVSDLPQVVAAHDTAPLPALRETRRRALADARADAERAGLLDCLRRADGNVTKAAELAGYSRAQFYRLMRRSGIRRPRQ